jgi:hypothetical protein
MKLFIALIAWCLLLVFAWPLAIAAVIFFPILWLLSIPFRIVGAALEAMLALIKALFLLPARLLRSSTAH